MENETKQDFLTGRERALLGTQYETLWHNEFECFCEIDEIDPGDRDTPESGGGVFVHKVFYNGLNVTDMLTESHLNKLSIKCDFQDLEGVDAYIFDQHTTIAELEETLTEKYYND